MEMCSIFSIRSERQQPCSSSDGATTWRQALEQEMAEAKQKAQGNRVSKKLTQARH
jgi:hypothetical protein